jgi:DNA-binding response OmpR family regulator
VRILIAEDNPFFRRALEATLRDWGHDVVSTGDGHAAWEALCGPDAPRLAILDWMMPGLDGLELCRRIRAGTSTAGTYVILLTAKGGKDNILAGLDGGADDFIRKPYERDELFARLQVGLRRRRPRRWLTADDGTTTLTIRSLTPP